MDDKIKSALEADVQEGFVEKIRLRSQKLLRMSAAVMCKYYDTWDGQHVNWRADKAPDAEDKKSKEKGQPTKMVAPLTYAQVMTFVAVAMMLLKQRNKFFELEAVEENDVTYRDVAETLLQQDLNYNKFDIILFQFLLYLCRCDLGIIDCCYVEHQQVVPVVEETTTDAGEDSVEIEKKTVRKQVLKYAGNELKTVSPYSFFPDPRVPLERLHDGEFCANEEEVSMAFLEELEAAGVVAGIENIQNFGSDAIELRRKHKTRFSIIKLDEIVIGSEVSNTVMLTKMQLKIIPSKFEIDDDGTKLGEETFPIKYLVWIANDNRVIRLEPMDYVHDRFTYEVARFTPDDHELLSKSLTEMLEKLQEAYDWFVNTRVQSVRRTLINQLVVDPGGIEMSTVNDRSPVILTKRGIGNKGIDQYLKQLQVQDVTAAHLTDASAMQGMMQVTTGVNDNAMGQYHGGRRSAREAGVVAQSAGARLRMTIGLIVNMAITPTGEKMLTTLRSSMPRERFDKVAPRMVGQVQEDVDTLWAQFHPDDVEQLVGNNDFFLFDSTLPSEKGFMAQALQELLGLLMQNPQAAAQFDMSPKLVLEEIMRLNGNHAGKRFSMFNDPQQLQQLLQQAMQYGMQVATQQMAAQPVQPGAEAAPVEGGPVV